MSTKKINAGDTLTVGDLTDDYLGAEIEVGTIVDVTYRFAFGGFAPYAPSMTSLWTPKVRVASFYDNDPVKVITPPPVVQPDEPTELGQCIRIEGSRELLGVFVDPGDTIPIRSLNGEWLDWEEALSRAGGRRIIVSDPPRWPDETPVVPERIEAGEWPDDDTHLREWDWIDDAVIEDAYRWRWYDGDSLQSGWSWSKGARRYSRPCFGPWTRGERVK